MSLEKKIKEIKLWSEMRIINNIPVEDAVYERGMKNMAKDAMEVIEELQNLLNCANHTLEEQNNCIAQNGELQEENQKLKAKLEIAKNAFDEIIINAKLD
jgi:hypothetical protein